MNGLKGLIFAAVMTVLMLTVAAFARDRNRHGVVIPETVQVGTSRLAPGVYTMEWAESGSTAKVTFVQNGKSVAQVPAKVVTLDRPAQTDSVTVKTGSGNTEALEQVEFGGFKEAFSFSDTPSGE